MSSPHAVAFSLVVLVITTASASYSQDLTGKTARIVYRSDTMSLPSNVYIGTNSVFVGGTNNSAGGIECGRGAAITRTYTCTKPVVRSCGGIFANFSGTDNISTTLTQSCSATVDAGRVCYKLDFVGRFSNSRGSGEGPSQDEFCINVQDGAACSASGTRTLPKETINYRSTSCVIVQGRRL